MSENTTEVVTGGAVLAVAIGFLIYAAQGAGLGGGGSSYPLTASFRSVEGVAIGTDVRMSGVKIGSVTGLALNPQTFMADATFTIAQGIEVPDDSTALISSEGLLGGSFLEIQPGGSVDVLAAGGEILDTQGSVSLITLLMRFVGGSGEEDTAQ